MKWSAVFIIPKPKHTMKLNNDIFHFFDKLSINYFNSQSIIYLNNVKILIKWLKLVKEKFRKKFGKIKMVCIEK